MDVGHSRCRLDRSAMPNHTEGLAFAEAVQNHLSTHPVLRNTADSRVALLARDEDVGVPKLMGGTEFWNKDPYA